MSKKELAILTPLIKNDISASEKIKTIDNYELYFLLIASCESLGRRGGSGGGSMVVLITTPIRNYYTFLQYFELYRYYVDIIETYRLIITGLGKLHEKGLVYGGFGVLKEDAIRLDAVKKRAYLYNFQYTYPFDMTDGSGTGDEMFVRLSSVDVEIPPYMWLILYLKKNNKQVFVEEDRDIIIRRGGLGVGIIDKLIGMSATTTATCELLKHYACCWDVYELTFVFLGLCERLCIRNKYFRVFVDILQSVVENGLGILTSEVLERLDKIIE